MSTPDKREDGAATKMLTIAPTKGVCQGMTQQLCLKVREPGEERFTYLYDSIEGFDFKWGTTSTIEVAERSVEGAPQDASSIRRELLSVLESEEDAIGSRYTFGDLGLMEHTIAADAGRYRFLGEAFLCSDGVNCDSLASAHSENVRVNLVFVYKGNGDIELVEWENASSQ